MATYIFVLAENIRGIFWFSRFCNCSDSVVFFGFLDFAIVQTVWYFFGFLDFVIVQTVWYFWVF
jgi:hypothetical protein